MTEKNVVQAIHDTLWEAMKADDRVLVLGEDVGKLGGVFRVTDKLQEEFDRAARSQASPTLAAAGGLIKPIGHNTCGNEELERAAFSLQPSAFRRRYSRCEISEILILPSCRRCCSRGSVLRAR